MQGSLALKDGVLWVARHGERACVTAFDLDGHRLGPGFALSATETGSAPRMTGLDVDSDRALWLADEANESVRSFSVFGVEGIALRDARVARASDVAVRGEDEEKQVWVASGGIRTGSIQIFSSAGERIDGLRSLGDPAADFRDVSGLALGERLAYVCELRGARVQVFRGTEFHFAFGLESGRPFEPTGAAPLFDERVLVTSRGESTGLYLIDRAGRLLSTLASGGGEDGELLEPTDVVVQEGADDRHTRVAVIDRDGDRVQVFSLLGRCYGAFPELE